MDASGVSCGCFEQPKFIFSKGSSHYVVNCDGTGEECLGVSGTGYSTISPDGEWIAWTVDSVEGGTCICSAVMASNEGKLRAIPLKQTLFSSSKCHRQKTGLERTIERLERYLDEMKDGRLSLFL